MSNTHSESGRHVVVAGAASSAVLHELLGNPTVVRITLLTTRRFLRMPHGIQDAVVDPTDWRDGLPHADHALLLMGATRRAREALYWHPQRADLLPLAAALQQRGVRTLEVVVLSPDVEPLTADERRQLQQLGLTLQPLSARPQLPGGLHHKSGSWPARLALWMIHTVWTVMQQLMVKGPRENRSRKR
ncbi:hypothetical protein [Hydrogenophaga sp.]|uniref:hypothetical protein n=1 Tax=Hydrogenophaga sp. TaxID=1904254 RepID=UPI0027248D69|nr:hypothetical protein [Hydrogenophaga sp.]MDO9438321.1 hypothetical protein [Hydrogenophaga sp.]